MDISGSQIRKISVTPQMTITSTHGRKISPVVLKHRSNAGCITPRRVIGSIIISCLCWICIVFHLFLLTDFGQPDSGYDRNKFALPSIDLDAAKRELLNKVSDSVDSIVGQYGNELPLHDAGNVEHRRKHELRKFYLDNLKVDPKHVEGGEHNEGSDILSDKNGFVIHKDTDKNEDTDIISDKNGFIVYADKDGQKGGTVGHDKLPLNEELAKDGMDEDQEKVAIEDLGKPGPADVEETREVSEKHEVAPFVELPLVNDLERPKESEVAPPTEGKRQNDGQHLEGGANGDGDNPLNDLPELKWEKVRDMNVRTMPHESNGPGENGQAAKARAEDRDRVAEQWEHAQFNEFLSDQISLERSLHDTRPKLCRQKEYPYNGLPKTSIIICFTDESWSTLMRTVHSVLNRSPPELVEEIILVDDFSQADHLKQRLDDYIARLGKVRLVRLEKREGLIRARLAGISASRAPVITFLDSHVEAQVGWLEPLLDRIRRNRTTVPAPVIDSIDAQHMGYMGADEKVRGGFTWYSLQFRWNPTPRHLLHDRQDPVDPIDSPTMAGGLFSMDKSYFYELGGYDPGLEIWGAENMELSFKVWLCGGKLEIVPCSHVGHIFRSKQPYKFPSGDNVGTFLRNTLRVVDVWMDDYTKVFYSVNGALRDKPHGDISDRLKFKEGLTCHKFDWYVKNVYTDLHIPVWKLAAEGELRNGKFSNVCLDSQAVPGHFGTSRCHGSGGNQAFRLAVDDTLQFGDGCVEVVSSVVLRTGPCRNMNVVHWEHTKGGRLQDKKTKYCLTAHGVHEVISLEQCTGEDDQNWAFGKYNGESHQSQ